MAHEPIGVSPLVSLFASDAQFLVTAAAGYDHLVGITRLLSIGWIISLVLSLITGNSIAQFEIIASFFFAFYHLFLASYCDPFSAGGPAEAVTELFF